MTGKTKVLLNVIEYITDSNGDEVQKKKYNFTYDMPDKYIRNENEMRKKVKDLVVPKIGKNHHLFIMVNYLNPETLEKRTISADYVPKKLDYVVGSEYTDLKSFNKSAKPKVSAGVKFDTAMEKGMAGVKKAGGVVGKGLDWFFMEGEYAHLRKKTPAKKTTSTKKKATSGKKKTTATKRKTTTRKTTTSTRSRQYAPSRQFDMMEDYPPYFEDYGMMPITRSGRYGRY